MTVKTLSNPELLERFNKLVRTERKITHLVLECIAEIDRRKLYSQKAYSSLFDYLVNEFGYSPSAANRRIASARLLREVPEMAEKIESGALNLSQLAKVHQAISTVQKTENRKVEVTEKRELLEKIENTTQDKTELILAQELNLPVEVIDRAKIHRDESVTLTISLSKEQMELLKKVGDLISHAVPEKKWAQVLTYLAQKELYRRTKKKELTRHLETQQGHPEAKPKDLSKRSFASLRMIRSARDGNSAQKSTSATEVKNLKNRPAIPTATRKTLLHADAKCEFKSPQGKSCDSRHYLQIDHIKSVSRGGGNELENLQVLCGAHNRYKYRTTSS